MEKYEKPSVSQTIISELQKEPFLGGYKYFKSIKTFRKETNGRIYEFEIRVPYNGGAIHFLSTLSVVSPLLTDWLNPYLFSKNEKFLVFLVANPAKYPPRGSYYFWADWSNYDEQYERLRKSMTDMFKSYQEMTCTWEAFYNRLIVYYLEHLESEARLAIQPYKYFARMAFAWIMNDMPRYKQLKQLLHDVLVDILEGKINPGVVSGQYQYYYDNFDRIIDGLESYDFAKYIKKHKIDLSK